MQISSEKRTPKLKYIDINIMSSSLPRYLKDHVVRLAAQFDVVVKFTASVFCCPYL